MTIKQIFIDFCGWTTASGIPHIGSSQSTCLRVFWTVVFVLSTGGFAYFFYDIMSKYLKYGVEVETQLKFEELDFPAVTICNQNPFKDTELLEFPEVQWLTANYTLAILKKLPPGDYWGFGKLQNNSIAIRARAQDHLMLISASYRKYNASTFNKTSYDKSELIMNCAYNTKACNIETDFSLTIDPNYGECYTFNGMVPADFRSSRAGPLYGLRLVLRNNQTEYIDLIDTAAVRVAVHGQGEQPFMDAFGLNAPAGSATSFGVKYIKTERKPYPYGDCVEKSPEEDYYYSGEYSSEGCYRSCIQKHIIDDCKCADPRFASPTDKYCTTKDIDCVSKYTSTSENFNPMEKCKCAQPCTEDTYSLTLSTSLWPSNVYQPHECLSKNTNPNWSDKNSCVDWYRRNTMVVEVFYERMNYQLLSEKEAYGFVMLISEAGGQIGMWTGISFITVVEFGALGVVLGLFFIHRKDPKKGPQPNETDEDDEESSDEDETEVKKDGRGSISSSKKLRLLRKYRIKTRMYT